MKDANLVADTIRGYVSEVLSGKIIAGELVKSACQRHKADLRRSRTKAFRYKFQENSAREAVEFFATLEHTTGEYDRKPFILEPFQQFIIGSVFGWRDKKTKYRRFNVAFISLGRGNGKSPIGAGVLLKCAVFDDPIEARAECYAVATKQRQAQIVHDECRRFIKRAPFIHKHMKLQQYILSVPANDSKIEALSSEGKTADGGIPHCVIVDELHAWKEEHRELFEKINTAFGKRPQPLKFIITTAGSDESDIWRQQYNLAKAIVQPGNEIEDDREFVFLAEIDDDDDELDESCWAKANPLLESGVVKIDHLRTMATQAKLDPSRRNEFRRYHCNKLTTSTLKPITSEMWSACAGVLPDLTDRPCFAGFDWGWRDDLSALGFVFPLDDIDPEGDQQQRYAVVADVWIPSDGRRNINREPFGSFVRRGWLTVTDGDDTNTQAIFDCLEQRNRDHEIRGLAYDASNCREFSRMSKNDLGIETTPFGQTCGRYNEPLREFINALSSGRIVHDGNGLLAWCATNMAISQDTRDYIMPNKQRSVDKIDPIVAIIMAMAEAMFAENTGMAIYGGGEPVSI